MATVTVLDATRTLQIEAASIVGGYINSEGHLILQKHDETEVDLGPVSSMRYYDGEEYQAVETYSYIGSADPGAVPDGTVWFDTNDTGGPSATTSQKGLVELATDTETATGTDSTRAVTPAGLNAAVSATYLKLEGGNVTGTIEGVIASAGTPFLGTLLSGEVFDRARLYPDGSLEFGPGNAARDIKLLRLGANRFGIQGGDFVVGTVGRGIRIAEGTNARMGTATLAAGTATVNTTAVTSNSRIFLTAQNTGGTPGALRVSARTPGTSFTITSTSGTDTSLVAWEIKEPA